MIVGAAVKLPSPGCSKRTVHVPVPLVMVTVAPATPVPEHRPAVVMPTGRPDEAVAATGKLVAKIAAGGGACVTEMVCARGRATVTSAISTAALKMVLPGCA